MKHLFDKQNKYSIRKFSIGVCSAVIGLSILNAGTAYAEGPEGAAGATTSTTPAVATGATSETGANALGAAAEGTTIEPLPATPAQTDSKNLVQGVQGVVEAPEGLQPVDLGDRAAALSHITDGNESTIWKTQWKSNKNDMYPTTVSVPIGEDAHVERVETVFEHSDLPFRFTVTVTGADGNEQEIHNKYKNYEGRLSVNRISAEVPENLRNNVRKVSVRFLDRNTVQGGHYLPSPALMELKVEGYEHLANYDAVRSAIDRVPDDLSIFTDASVTRLVEARNRVELNKKRSEQETVAAYATAIEEAISGLQPRPIPTTTVPSSEIVPIREVITSSGENANHLTDKDPTTIWTSAPADTTSPQYIQAELEELATISSVYYLSPGSEKVVGGIHPKYLTRAKLQYSVDGSEWVDLMPTSVSGDSLGYAKSTGVLTADGHKLGANHRGKTLYFNPVQAKFIRLVGTDSFVNLSNAQPGTAGKDFSAAEFSVTARKIENIPVADTVTVDPNRTTASSEGRDGNVLKPASQATDGIINANNFWNAEPTTTKFSAAGQAKPYIQIGLREPALVSHLSYTPRTALGAANGNLWQGYIEYQAPDGSWQRVTNAEGQPATFELPADTFTQTLHFTPVVAQDFRLVATKTFGYLGNQAYEDRFFAATEVSTVGRKLIEGTTDIPASADVIERTDRYHETQTLRAEESSVGVGRSGQVFLTANGEKTGDALPNVTAPTTEGSLLSTDRPLSEARAAKVFQGTHRPTIAEDLTAVVGQLTREQVEAQITNLGSATIASVGDLPTEAGSRTVAVTLSYPGPESNPSAQTVTVNVPVVLTNPVVTPKYTTINEAAAAVELDLLSDENSEENKNKVRAKLNIPTDKTATIEEITPSDTTDTAGPKTVLAKVKYSDLPITTTVEVKSTNSGWAGNDKNNVLTDAKETFWASVWSVSGNTAENRESLTLVFNELTTIDKVRYQPQFDKSQHGKITKGHIEYETEDGRWERLDLLSVTPSPNKRSPIGIDGEENFSVPSHDADGYYQVVTFEVSPVKTRRIRLIGEETFSPVVGVRNHMVAAATFYALGTHTDIIEVPVTVVGELKDHHQPTIGHVRVPRLADITEEMVKAQVTDLADGAQITAVGNRPTTAEAGVKDPISVTVTYPDNSTDVVSVPVTVTALATDTHHASAEAISVPRNTEITRVMVEGKVRIPDGSNGRITNVGDIPTTSEAGAKDPISVTVTYPDNSTDVVSVPVTVTALATDTHHASAEAISVPRNTEITRVMVEGKVRIPDGSNGRITNVGDIPTTSEAGAKDPISVTVTYPDNSTDVVSVPVTVTALATDTHHASAEAISVPRNTEITRIMVEGKVRIPDGSNGRITNVGDIPATSEAGAKDPISVTVTYPDNSTDVVSVPVTVTALATDTHHASAEAISVPRNTEITRVMVEGKVRIPDGSNGRITIVGDIPTTSEAGAKDPISVTVTYPDNSTDVVSVPVTVTANKSDDYLASAGTIIKKIDDELTDNDIKAAVTVPAAAGDVTKVLLDPVPVTTEAGSHQVSVKVIYSDNSEDTVEVTVEVVDESNREDLLALIRRQQEELDRIRREKEAAEEEKTRALAEKLAAENAQNQAELARNTALSDLENAKKKAENDVNIANQQAEEARRQAEVARQEAEAAQTKVTALQAEADAAKKKAEDAHLAEREAALLLAAAETAKQSALTELDEAKQAQQEAARKVTEAEAARRIAEDNLAKANRDNLDALAEATRAKEAAEAATTRARAELKEATDAKAEADQRAVEAVKEADKLRTQALTLTAEKDAADKRAETAEKATEEARAQLTGAEQAQADAETKLTEALAARATAEREKADAIAQVEREKETAIANAEREKADAIAAANREKLAAEAAKVIAEAKVSVAEQATAVAQADLAKAEAAKAAAETKLVAAEVAKAEAERAKVEAVAAANTDKAAAEAAKLIAEAKAAEAEQAKTAAINELAQAHSAKVAAEARLTAAEAARATAEREKSDAIAAAERTKSDAIAAANRDKAAAEAAKVIAEAQAVAAEQAKVAAQTELAKADAARAAAEARVIAAEIAKADAERAKSDAIAAANIDKAAAETARLLAEARVTEAERAKQAALNDLATAEAAQAVAATRLIAAESAKADAERDKAAALVAAERAQAVATAAQDEIARLKLELEAKETEALAIANHEKEVAKAAAEAAAREVAAALAEKEKALAEKEEALRVAAQRLAEAEAARKVAEAKLAEQANKDNSETQVAPSPARLIKDQATGVAVALAAGEDSRIVALRVIHKETNHTATPSVLAGKDYDLFDIELVDQNNRIIKTKYASEVTLPIDSGKEVAEVIYLPNSDVATILPFRTTVLENGQLAVVFTAAHFSEYGIVYRVVSPVTVTEEPVVIPTDSSNTPEQPVDPTTPTETPVEPTVVPTTLTETPVDPTVSPATPSEAPVAPTVTPLTPTEFPVDTPAPRTDVTPGKPVEDSVVVARLTPKAPAAAAPVAAPSAAAPAASAPAQASLPETGDEDSMAFSLGMAGLMSALGLMGVKSRKED